MGSECRSPFNSTLIVAILGVSTEKQLKSRLDEGIEYLKARRHSFEKGILALCGSTTEVDRTNKSEANYMTECTSAHFAIPDASAIEVVSDASASNTAQNLAFIRSVIRGTPGQIHLAIVSSEYHIPRVALLSEIFGFRVNPDIKSLVFIASQTPSNELTFRKEHEIINITRLIAGSQHTQIG